MGQVYEQNLANCRIRNHQSIENFGDNTFPFTFGSLDGPTLPNVVLIEVYSTQVPPPTWSETGNGFWAVHASNFNIGDATTVVPVFPTTNWADNTPTVVGSYTNPDGSLPNDAVNIPNQNGIGNNGIYQIGAQNNVENSVGRWFTEPYMLSVEANNNWDDKVNDIMICDFS